MPLYKSFGLICLFDMLSAGEPCACLCRNVTAAVLRRWDVSGAGMNQNRSDLIGWIKKVGSSSGWVKKVGWHNTFGGLECHSWLAWLFLGNRLQAARKVLWTVFSKCDSSSSYIYIYNYHVSFDYVQWDVIVFQRTSYTEHSATCDTKYAYIPRWVCIWTSHIIFCFFLMHVAEVWTIEGSHLHLVMFPYML